MLLHWLFERGLEGFLEGVCAWLCIPPPPGSADRTLGSGAGPAGPRAASRPRNDDPEPPGGPVARCKEALDGRAGRGHVGI
jgi:hypothetical protein